MEEIPKIIDTEEGCDEFCDESDFPSFKIMGIDFAKHIFLTFRKLFLGKKILATKQQARDRMKICEECEFFTKKKRCIHCGCYMMYKIHIKDAACPMDKWPTGH